MARVSKGTVSKILNNKPGISQDTRRRVMDIVGHLDYIPNSAAQALAYQRTNNIGLVIPHEAGISLAGSYWSALITAIAQTAEGQNYNLMLLTPHIEGDLEQVYDSVLRSHKVDGLIIGAELVDKRSLSRIVLADLPLVMVGQNSEFHHYFVDINNHRAAYQMTEHMIECGKRHPAFISGPLEYQYNRERVQGFTDALAAKGISGATGAVEAYDTHQIQGEVLRLLRDNPGIDSLFIGAGGDFMLDVIDQLRRNHIDFNHFGLAVFDDYPYLNFLNPRLTAVHQPIHEMGVAATTMLMKLIQNQSLDHPSEIIETHIVVRGSCGEPTT